MLVIINNSFNRQKSVPSKELLLKNTVIAPNNKYYVSNYFNNTEAEYFNITYLKYAFSYKFNLIKVEYNVVFYDKNDKIIAPSNLSLYNNLHLICHTEMKEPYITSLDSLAYNHKNEYYICVEFVEMRKKIKFGVKLYQQPKEEYDEDQHITWSTKYLFDHSLFDLKNFKYENDDLFDPMVINKYYTNFARNVDNKYRNQTLKLKRYYMEFPFFQIKANAIIEENKWFFRNVYNYHFCSCKGDGCLDKRIGSRCKFFFYLYILDNNRNLYEKTDYLFVDLYFKEFIPEDTYPIFREMAKQNYPVHYMTERQDIYDEYCTNGTKLCLNVIKIDRFNYTISGSFFENYFELFLKLRAVVTARWLNFMGNAFYNTEYITYIYVGNGLNYFKPYLYGKFRALLERRFDKIVMPNSEKLISMLKSNGYLDEEIIRLNFPRWDKYYRESNERTDYKNKTILLYFSQRDMNPEKVVSNLYMDNIKLLLTNKDLNRQLKKKM